MMLMHREARTPQECWHCYLCGDRRDVLGFGGAVKTSVGRSCRFHGVCPATVLNIEQPEGIESR